MSPFGFTLGMAALLSASGVAEAPPHRPLPPVEVCGPGLLGAAVPTIAEAGGCGIAAPVRLSAAAGVALEPAPLIACPAARALAAWLAQGAAPAFAAKGARLVALTVADSYSCRKRNRAPEGKISEHALGHAIEVGGFRLSDGTTVTVRDDWNSAEWGAALRAVHDAGCGPFGTALGPESNALHADHLHFDTADRSGPGFQ